MSYSFTTDTIERSTDDILEAIGQIPAAIDNAYNQWSKAGQEQNGTEHEARHAIDHATNAALLIVEALGLHWKSIRVSIVGHANPGNKERPGWSPEFCQVKVDVVEYQS